MNDKDRQLFANEVKEGLGKEPKALPSKWLYDEKGDELFVKIMGLEEYYLTDCEFEIFNEQSTRIIEALGDAFHTEFFELIELGAGDGTKTIELLTALKGQDFSYRPIDISSSAIAQLESRVKAELPWVNIKGLQGEYFQVLESIAGANPKLVLFLGSNIGNMKDDQANEFLLGLSDNLNVGDKLILGVDLKKSSDIVLPAYNDSSGVTASFNLNLLDRINKELHADFDASQFSHEPQYQESEGIARSFLVSLCDQEVYLKDLDMRVKFKQGEPVQTEVSRKYDAETLNRLLKGTGLQIIQKFTDHRNYFVDFLIERVER